MGGTARLYIDLGLDWIQRFVVLLVADVGDDVLLCPSSKAAKPTATLEESDGQ